jgi:putative flippase GtrA
MLAGTPPVDAATAAAEAVELEHGHPVAKRRGLLGRLRRFEHLLHELGKFGVVGSTAFVVDVTIFNVLLTQVKLEPLTAAAIAMSVAATVGFVGNRFWTWRDRERSGLRREYALYFMFNLGGLLMALGCLAISHYGLGAVWPLFTTALADNVAKTVIGTAVGTVFRFWSYRRFVFRAGPVGDPTLP